MGFAWPPRQGFARLWTISREYVTAKECRRTTVQRTVFNLAASRYSGDPFKNYYAGARDNLAAD